MLKGSNASEHEEKYWHSVLPNSPLPKALQDIFHQSNWFKIEDFSENTKDATIICNTPRHSHQMNLPADATVIYGKPRNSQKRNREYDGSAPTTDLWKVSKDATVIYGKPKDLKNLQNEEKEILATDFSEITNDATKYYGKPKEYSDLWRNLKDATVIYGKPKELENLQNDNKEIIATDFSEITNDATKYYGKPKEYSDLWRNLKDATVIYGKPKELENLQNDKKENIGKDFSEITNDATKYYGKPKEYSDLWKNLKDATVIYEKPKELENLQNDKKENVAKDFPEITNDATKHYGKPKESQVVMHQQSYVAAAEENMTLLFTNAGNKVGFLPRELAESTPFSTDKLPEILARFAIDPKSADAEVVKDTISDCENPPRVKEVKYCATSLESLVDQTVARLGTNNIRVISTPEGKKQEYTVLAGVRRTGDDRLIVCHKERYPYAVYYCHEIGGTEVYTVPLIGADGTKLKAVTICHKDTSGWSPDYMGFIIKT
ncbi:hypothetical protein Tsubulata_016444, partial [Turnera subulata]